MDFVRIVDATETKKVKGEDVVRRRVYPDFVVRRSQDLLVRGERFYAIWDPKKGLWSTDEYDVQRLVDEELVEYVRANPGVDPEVMFVSSYSSGVWGKFQSYIKSLSDNGPELDSELVFENDTVIRESFASKRLPYSLEKGECTAFLELVETLYDEEELEKILWAIGAIVEGDSKWIQKFLVLYGAAGAGKSTVLNIVQWLFAGYYTMFDAKALGSSSSQFATEVFKSNPLVAIQHDGDLSRIEDNTRINSIVSHEEMVLNEKFKASYSARINAFLFMGTNKPVKITDAKSGIIRRLIDVTPSGRRLPAERYFELMDRIKTELGAIAWHCREFYRERGSSYYDAYRPINMMLKTDVFYNFIEACYLELKYGITLSRAWTLYRQYCDEALVEYKMPQYRFREELKSYFEHFEERVQVEGERRRNWYSGFRMDRLQPEKLSEKVSSKYWLDLDEIESPFDILAADYPAQYASSTGAPSQPWDRVDTTLAGIVSTEKHYVRVPENHIVIDFDLKDEDGVKSRDLNREAAAKWPQTYAEWSQGGNGIHLHYIYDGDDDLALEYAPGIEIKQFRGKASLRRRLNGCNGLSVAHIEKDLPRKDPKPMALAKDFAVTQDSIRRQVIANLRKEVHPATKPSMDFIKHILDEAYASGVSYDVSDLRPSILTFAMGSTNQKDACLRILSQLKLESDDEDEPYSPPEEGPLIMFDVEVYPNLFVVCWKQSGTDAIVPMINPTPEDIGKLLQMNLVGFNNRRYDNHILWARYLGYTNEDLFALSSRIVGGDRNALFREAYNVSYTDIYDYSSKKQSLKKWGIELGLHHLEMDIPWDQPVAEEDVPRVVKYCENDVELTDALHLHLQPDFIARKILSAISGLTVNHTTNACTQEFLFGKDKNPPFVHTDLSKEFPGYLFQYGKSTYKGIEVGEGGYVYAEPGYYKNVKVFDVASMHPASIVALKCFGEEYTKRFEELKEARVAVKHGELEKAGRMLDGALKPYLSGDLGALAYALKIAINSVYGLTAAKFPNRCNGGDPSNNLDNIVAKRGALFMVDLQKFLEAKGVRVIHIKTDSIKLADVTPELEQEILDFGAEYGYEFEVEDQYDRMVLVNDAVYIAHDEKGWHATGKQFAEPYVFKTLFSGEDITFADLVQTRAVSSNAAIHLNYGDEDSPQRRHVGRIGTFVNVKDEAVGGTLQVTRQEGKFTSLQGTKGYRWALEEDAKLADPELLSHAYVDHLVEDARAEIEKHVPYVELVS